MQNNVTELTQRLLRSLDANYNVIDMPAVIEIISLLEKVTITKELLETTRLGKHVNELRRKTNNDSLSKRAKELVKKWRSMVLPEPNGQIKPVTPSEQEDVNLNQLKSKKRPAKDVLDTAGVKRSKVNGMSELDFSDNSNSSFKDVINYNVKAEPKRDVISINSDSNSSLPEFKHDPHLDQQMPKKRGRKKGSKNHKNLIDEAESSFTNKLAVSRGNSKVKTTQELIASLQNKNTNSIGGLNAKNKEDLNERAAKLTERVSIIDQKLNTNSNRYKNSSKKVRNNLNDRNDRVIESGSVINDKSLINNHDEDIIVVDDLEPPINTEIKDEKTEKQETEDEVFTNSTTATENSNIFTSLTVEEALSQLPPIDKSVLLDVEEEPKCSCFLIENKPDFSVEDDAEDLEHKFEFAEDPECKAKSSIEDKYHLDGVTNEMIERLHNTCLPNVNGNFSLGSGNPPPVLQENGLFVNVVPNVNNESVPRDFSSENYKKYSISECGKNGDLNTERTGENNPDDISDKTFRGWHQVIETPSYNGEILKILPYVIID